LYFGLVTLYFPGVNHIRALEELSFRTLPALEQERIDGWVLRWSDGGARRANSVTVVAHSETDVARKIVRCERWFADRGAPPIFRLTSLADSELDRLLATRGYVRTAPTDVMTAAVDDPPASPDVAISDAISDDWMRTIAGNADADAERLQRLRDQLTGSGGANLFAAITDGTAMSVAIGLGIVLDGVTTIYNMHTSPEHRRRGHARKILRTLLAAGRKRDSRLAMLQVTEENGPAQALYRSEGFTRRYGYWYRELSADGVNERA